MKLNLDEVSAEIDESDFTLSDGINELLFPTGIPNDSITRISVKAVEGSGLPGSCVIPVNGA